MGCKLALHGKAIVYALKNGIKTVADGSNFEQRDYPEQRKPAIEKIKKLYQKYDIDYVNPVYDKTKSEVKEKLIKYDLTPKSLEGFCMFGNSFSKATDEQIEKYLKKKLPIIKSYIKNQIGDKNG